MGLYSLSRFREFEFVDTVDREYADDLDALDGAHELCTEYTIEVYETNRFVARVKQGGETISVRDEVTAGMNVVRTTRYRLDQSKAVIARTSELYARSFSALNRSQEALARITKRVLGSWDSSDEQ